MLKGDLDVGAILLDKLTITGLALCFLALSVVTINFWHAIDGVSCGTGEIVTRIIVGFMGPKNDQQNDNDYHHREDGV